MNKEVSEYVNKRIINWLIEENDLKDKLENWLIEEKDYIFDIINEEIFEYYNIKRDLNENDLKAINFKRKEINYIYELIDKINESRNKIKEL